jgi:serine/threonine-protein kinase
VRRGERLPAPGSLTGPFTPTRARPILTPPKPAKKTPTPPRSPRVAAAPVHRLATPPAPAKPVSSKSPATPPSSPRRPAPAVAARPVELRAGSGRGRTLLLVLFVLLTVAAVVVGVYVVRNLGAGPTPQGMSPGTVDGRAVALLHEPGDVR